jgi:hypothetical protein
MNKNALGFYGSPEPLIGPWFDGAVYVSTRDLVSFGAGVVAAWILSRMM